MSDQTLERDQVTTARAQARFVHVTPMKARRVVDLVRGMQADRALAILRFAPQAVAENFYKLVDSAASNAETTEGLDRSSLIITVVQVDEGPTMKRWRPRAKGAANRILKRSSHLTVVVQPREIVQARVDAANIKNSKKKGGNR